jgi:hypothetical protein
MMRKSRIIRAGEVWAYKDRCVKVDVSDNE